jgi:hypothetical protein
MIGAPSAMWVADKTSFVANCRVGILNDIGELLKPRVAVLLIGERPGLATAESLSAYMAYRPKALDTDANRNLISNIHVSGLSTKYATQRILNLAALMMSKCQRKHTVDRLNPSQRDSAIQQTLTRLVFVPSSKMITAGLPVTRVLSGEALMSISEPNHTPQSHDMCLDAGCRRDLGKFYFPSPELQVDTRVRGTLLTVWVSTLIRKR